MNEGNGFPTRLGLRGWPHAAEDIIVARNNHPFPPTTGAHIHMQPHQLGHVGRPDAGGRRRTASTSRPRATPPHHIALNRGKALGTYDNQLQDEPAASARKRTAGPSSPGSRTAHSTCIGTDHAPHTPDEKDREFDYAPNGITRARKPPCPSASPSSSAKAKFKPPAGHRPHDPAGGRDPETTPPARSRPAPQQMSACSIPNEKLALRRPDRIQQIAQLAMVRPATDRPASGRPFVSGRIVYSDGKIIVPATE